MSLVLIGAFVAYGCNRGTGSGGSTPAAVPKSVVWTKLGDFGGVSGDISDTFELKGSRQRLDWTLTGGTAKDFTVTFIQRTDRFGIRSERYVVAPKADSSAKKGSETTLLPVGTYTMRVVSRGSWAIRLFDERGN
ncbi:MAG: hypothetical protein ACOYON_05575 [Fimbriimonas sp.]